MPSAPQWLADQWPGGLEEAEEYLNKAGYTLTSEWTWNKPLPQYQPTERECSAISYLIEEWDYGGIVGEYP